VKILELAKVVSEVATLFALFGFTAASLATWFFRHEIYKAERKRAMRIVSHRIAEQQVEQHPQEEAMAGAGGAH
jgi:hypothetical protein